MDLLAVFEAHVDESQSPLTNKYHSQRSTMSVVAMIHPVTKLLVHNPSELVKGGSLWE